MKYFVLYMVECADNKITQIIKGINILIHEVWIKAETHYNFKVMSLKQVKLRLSGVCGLPTAPGPDEVGDGLLKYLLSDLH